MCGIAGIFGFDGLGEELSTVTTRMGDLLSHRGPDDAGVWMDRGAQVALIHRRLSIVDLSPSGHQPMKSHDGRYVIVFNGEIYNHTEIRRELDAAVAGIGWHGHSDTETLLEAISRWGIDAALRKSVGMYAFALWDAGQRRLHLVRDRMGEKPLYYGRIARSIAFSSELKGLAAHPAWTGELNRDSLVLFMRHGYVPAPHSIYSGIWKLNPGSMLTITDPVGDLMPQRRYWSAVAAASNGVADPVHQSAEETTETLELLLRQAVRQQMEADVPLGAFLSGGIDSSIVVAIMQSESSTAVKTFTIGFHEDDYDEARYAKSVAGHLGTNHTELYVTPEEALATVPLLPRIYDEPFADPSQIPTFLVSRLARTQVTVSLSGDGGDELFGGYNRYFWGRDLWRFFRLVPPPVRMLLAKGIGLLSPASWDYLYHHLSPTTKRNKRQKLFGDKLLKLMEILPATTPEQMYRLLTSMWKQPNGVVLQGLEPALISDSGVSDVVRDSTLGMMLSDTITYLPDDILVKLDRASMAVSLESRVPFLDHRLVEYAWRIPLSLKIDKNIGKIVLRRILHKLVPPALVDRPKQGFGVPIDSWLRGPLREWGEELLDEKRLVEDGYLNAHAVRGKWNEHQSKRRNWQYLLWCALMFQQWLADGKELRIASKHGIRHAA
jgi:asparagine synthase (glutamine-hydrolysing)